MGDLVTIVVSGGAGAALMGLFVWRGYRVKATRLTLPFFEADLSRFEELSAVRFFNDVSARLLAPAQVATSASESPLILIHAGWNLVCEAFVRRFKAYPEDTHIMAAASMIGGQNVEFIKMYRDIHANSIRYAAQVTPEFAANYLVRAPSLAERIDHDSFEQMPELTEDLIRGASSIIRNGPGRPDTIG